MRLKRTRKKLTGYKNFKTTRLYLWNSALQRTFIPSFSQLWLCRYWWLVPFWFWLFPPSARPQSSSVPSSCGFAICLSAVCRCVCGRVSCPARRSLCSSSWPPWAPWACGTPPSSGPRRAVCCVWLWSLLWDLRTSQIVTGDFEHEPSLIFKGIILI